MKKLIPSDTEFDIAGQMRDRKEVELAHSGESNDSVYLPWRSESAGTRRLFALAGPWLDILENGYTVCIDELDTSMHPLMVTALLRLLFDEKTNPKGAQVIFTTHNPLLLDSTLLRRDQVWFADKDDRGESHLYPLTDYAPRKGESLVRGYLAGRYGAVPFIPQGLLGTFLPNPLPIANPPMSAELPWWQAAKAQSLARRAAAAAANATAKPGDAFLIVTEGEVTEPVYFELLRSDLQLPAVRIRVEPGKASDPRHVIESAATEVKVHARLAKKGLLSHTEPLRFEQVWAVVDTDVAVRQGFWNEVESLAAARKVKLAHSTPCFEFWLLLHIQGQTTRSDLVNGDAAKSAVKHALGRDYSTDENVARAVMPTFIAKWPEAVVHAERVRAYHRDANTPPPANPSTEICALVRALNDSAPVHLRKL